MSAITNMIGVRHGKLTGVAFVGRDAKGFLVWKFRCDCGKEIERVAGSIRRGLTTSCGCARLDHGGWKTKTYDCWRNMKARVRDNAYRSKEYYGGLAIDPRWAKSFEAFLADMGECPEGLTLDRTNNRLGYFKENCRWATRAEQSANTSRTHFVTYKNERICLMEACRRSGMVYRLAMKRMESGMSAQEALDGS